MIQHVIDGVGVNFDSGVGNTAVRSSAQISDARGRSADQYNFVFKRSGGKLALHHVHDRVIRIGALRPAIVDGHAADAVRFHLQLVAELQANHSGLIVVHGHLLGGHAHVKANGLHLQRSIQLGLRQFSRGIERHGQQRTPQHTIGVRQHVEKAHGALAVVVGTEQRGNIRHRRGVENAVGVVPMHQVQKVLLAGRGIQRILSQ